MSGFIIAVHGAAHCVLQPVEESSSRHHVVAVLSEKMEICRVQCWGGSGQLGANRGQPCAASLLHSDLLSTIYPLQDNNGTLKTWSRNWFMVITNIISYPLSFSIHYYQLNVVMIMVMHLCCQGPFPYPHQRPDCPPQCLISTLIIITLPQNSQLSTVQLLLVASTRDSLFTT